MKIDKVSGTAADEQIHNVTSDGVFQRGLLSCHV